MQTATLGRTGHDVSMIGLGAWQIGDAWGTVADDDARQVVRAATDAGVTFIDTADVYGSGRSERFIGEYLAGDHPPVFVATKVGRRVDQLPENYTEENFRAWLNDSRSNLGVDRIDLVQLHCPPTAVLEDDDVFSALDGLVEEGLIASYGVSVETTEQALIAIARPNVATVQIILNCLRLKPLERVLPTARTRGVGIIARVPLASGLLSGRFDARTTFAADDHRNFNRRGEAFDIGETFAGVPYDVGLSAVAHLRELVPEGMTLSQFALRWVMDQPGVSTVIPGASTPDQARANAAVAQMPSLTDEHFAGVRRIYDDLVRPHVHHRW
ncbi:aldo/keto reductase [Pseudactinotalea sp. Z1739]|uniref:aldo/keto reductase n=1 Tax=Pseudactinotalea sp. Z1739 TaxID=3413028 RepID=UPI003C798107